MLSLARCGSSHTSWLTAAQDSEPATDATWSDGRAAQDGSGTVPTLSGDLQAAEICVLARQWSNTSEYRFNSRPERVNREVELVGEIVKLRC